eukprot:TRINITY_DN4971_c0_g1_i7.p2 TRINITY_DN4971_c0_g1~~TRINITY_DN4971_c0_g1_i7.p2  ORF type:complete len:110 (-),score=22.63 TRINITY_DN4971_c0_g1_i7:298-627(-)
MEVELLKREALYDEFENSIVESEKIARMEIMEGSPVSGESIPVRIHLGPYQRLTPTYKDHTMAFEVRYYINLVIVDMEERRYYKQSELILWRACPTLFYYVENNDGSGR